MKMKIMIKNGKILKIYFKAKGKPKIIKISTAKNNKTL